jgi:feruloyl-CoA synthase
VINTQRMICANQAMLAQAFPFFDWAPPVLLDWLPWSHTFGSNHNFGMALVHGGTFHFDAGRPMPGGIEETVANLNEIAPTAYFNVPKGFEALLPHFKSDARLRAKFFSRLKMLFYAGAGLAPEIFHAYRDMAKRETGRAMPFVTGLGATETSPSALMCLMDVDEPGNMGHPMAGVELKLAPVDGKLEARVRAPTVMPGYWRDAELTRQAFDEEGFYRFGDGVRFATPGDPAGGFLFDGRIAEDFKLATGTWVSVGPLRAALISALAPLAKDAVIAGHDRDDVAALIFPDLEACRLLADRGDLADPKVREAFRKRLAAFAAKASGSANRVERILLLAEPPSLDAGEITDKGSLNQRVVLQSRAGAAATLYDPESEAVIRAL